MKYIVTTTIYKISPAVKKFARVLTDCPKGFYIPKIKITKN